MFARRGFTLIELLVVIMVILAVTALAIGVAVPDVTQRRIREASRQINAFFQGAKARAAEIGRPVAVIIEPGNGLAAFTLKYAEVPPPYAGDTLNSVAFITSPGPGGWANTGVVRAQTSPTSGVDDVGWQGILRAGDLIQFNNQGHYFEIYGPANAQGYINSPDWRIRPVGTTNMVRNPIGPNPYNASQPQVPLRYQVFRQPIASAASAMELPEGAVVDLSVSGPEGQVFNPPPTANQPVAIIISPGGSVLRCYSGGAVCPPNQPLYLLVGNPEGVGPPYANLRDFQTIWVTVNHQSGLVTSVENFTGTNITAAQLNRARDYARKAQSLGGRSG